jgi:hypothetical protein
MHVHDTPAPILRQAESVTPVRRQAVCDQPSWGGKPTADARLRLPSPTRGSCEDARPTKHTRPGSLRRASVPARFTQTTGPRNPVAHVRRRSGTVLDTHHTCPSIRSCLGRKVSSSPVSLRVLRALRGPRHQTGLAGGLTLMDPSPRRSRRAWRQEMIGLALGRRDAENGLGLSPPLRLRASARETTF